MTDIAFGEAAAGRPSHMRVSLRAKATFALLFLAAYAIGMFVYVAHERSTVLASVARIDRIVAAEDALTRAGLSISDALFLVNRLVSRPADARDGAAVEFAFSLEELRGALRPVLAEHPALEARLGAVESAMREFRAEAPLASLFELRVALNGIARDVDREAVLARERRRALNDAIRSDYERVALVSLALGLAGLAMFGLGSRFFFARLAAQIDSVRERAAAIVRGYRGVPLAIARRDEVGDLARAVDQMAADLAERERRIELAARQQMHRERMAALGAMAANVAHEINNPLATISALAQDMAAHRAATSCSLCRPEQLIEQTDRIARMTRHLAELASARRGEAEPVDLSAAAGIVCELLRFDPRLRHTSVVHEPAAGASIALAIPDDLTHILMNLILAAAEAAPATGARTGAIRVQAGVEGGGPFVRVAADRDPAAETPAAGFDDSARLSVSQALAAQMGGGLEVAREPAAQATLRLPAAYAGEGR